jgi:hypothetical protein
MVSLTRLWNASEVRLLNAFAAPLRYVIGRSTYYVAAHEVDKKRTAIQHKKVRNIVIIDLDGSRDVQINRLNVPNKNIIFKGPSKSTGEEDVNESLLFPERMTEQGSAIHNSIVWGQVHFDQITAKKLTIKYASKASIQKSALQTLALKDVGALTLNTSFVSDLKGGQELERFDVSDMKVLPKTAENADLALSAPFGSDKRVIAFNRVRKSFITPDKSLVIDPWAACNNPLSDKKALDMDNVVITDRKKEYLMAVARTLLLPVWAVRAMRDKVRDVRHSFDEKVDGFMDHSWDAAEKKLRHPLRKIKYTFSSTKKKEELREYWDLADRNQREVTEKENQSRREAWRRNSQFADKQLNTLQPLVISNLRDLSYDIRDQYILTQFAEHTFTKLRNDTHQVHDVEAWRKHKIA